MNIDNKILAFLQWQGDAGTEQVIAAVNEAPKLVYQALRRLVYEGSVERAGKTRRMTVRWKLTKGKHREQERKYQSTGAGRP